MDDSRDADAMVLELARVIARAVARQDHARERLGNDAQQDLPAPPAGAQWDGKP